MAAPALIACSGDDGAQGAQGEIGPVGADGATGANGATGATGANGADGADGAKRADGANGADGADGQPGAAGPAGPQGPQGQSGTSGTTCFQSMSTNTVAIPILVVNTPTNVNGMLGNPVCTDANVTFNAGVYTFVEAGTYLVGARVDVQPPLALETFTLSTTLNGAPGPQSFSCFWNNDTLLPMACSTQFLVTATAGSTFNVNGASNLLGNIVIGGVVSIQRVK